MIILSTQERKYETKTFNENFAQESSNLPFAVPGVTGDSPPGANLLGISPPFRNFAPHMNFEFLI
jgi:hypothetical protein